MDLCPSWEVSSFCASQEIPANFIVLNFHCLIHKIPPPVSFLFDVNPVRAPLPTSRRTTLILSSHLCLCIACGLFQSVFSTKTSYTPFLFPICATCPTFLILRNLITRIIFGEHYRSLSSSLCNFLHSPATSSHLIPNILLNTLFSNTISLLSSLNVSDHFCHLYNSNKHNYSSVYLQIYILLL